MVGWHHRLNEHEFEQALEDGEGQGSLVCCSPWVAKNQTQLSDWTTTTYCVARGTLLNVTWQPGWEGSLGKNGHGHMYG